METAYDKVMENYLTEEELLQILKIEPKTLRDLRSHHRTGKKQFIPYTNPTSKCRLYHVNDILEYLEASPYITFNYEGS